MKANPLTDDVKITVAKPEREAGLAATTGSASMRRISKFLRICQDPGNPTERAVVSNPGDVIGLLWYFKRWREWVLVPEPKTIWSHECLEAIRVELRRHNTKPSE